MNRTDHETRKQIIPRIDPAERVTMHFLDEKGLNAEVTGTTEELGELAIETNVPHIKQRILVPFRLTEVSEDLGHYTRYTGLRATAQTSSTDVDRQ